MSDSPKPPILVAGDAVAPTGFARVTEGILRPLQGHFEIHQLGTNFHGDPHELPWPVYPAGSQGHVFGANRLPKLIEKIQPKLVFIVNDIWVIKDYMEALAPLPERPPIVTYCPIDAAPIEREAILPLDGIARMVAYTEFGRSALEAGAAQARIDKPDLDFPAVEVLPHGIDADKFFPMEGADENDRRLTARRALLPDEPGMEDAFIVLNANRNQPRKRIDVTMKGFAAFAKDKPANVKLFLHMGAEDQGWNVVQMARRLGIQNRLLLSTLSKDLPPFTTNHLNTVYNACDVGINTSCGEGWGLVSFEHAATGAAQIVPGFGVCRELWEDKALLLKSSMVATNHILLTEGELIAPETVAEALEKIYADDDLRADLTEKAYAEATRPDYQWAAISKRWRTLFDEVIAGTG